MEIVYALAIGVLSGSGVWLLLRPRTFQVLMGLSLLSYAVNLFILAMGRLAIDKAPDCQCGRRGRHDVVCRSGTAGAGAHGDCHRLRDHRSVSRRIARVARIDGHGSRRRSRGRRVNSWLQHLPVAPVVVPLVAGAAILLFAESRRSDTARPLH